MNILVVDDEIKFADLVAEYLSTHGHTVTQVYDGKIALNACEDQEFDLFIVDLFMPNLDGFELIVELKRKYSDPKLIVMSGMARFGNDFLGAAEKLGANVALVKPFSQPHLQAEIVRLCES